MYCSISKPCIRQVELMQRLGFEQIVMTEDIGTTYWKNGTTIKLRDNDVPLEKDLIPIVIKSAYNEGASDKLKEIQNVLGINNYSCLRDI